MKAIHLISWLVLFPVLALAEENVVLIPAKTETASLGEYARIGSSALKINVVVVDSAKTSIAISPDGPLTRPMPPSEAFAVWTAILRQNGFTFIYDPSLEVYSVMRERDARDYAPAVTRPQDLPKQDQAISYLMNLEHVPADEVARTLRSVTPIHSRVIPIDATNSLLFVDSASSIPKYQDLIRRVDTRDQTKDWARLRKESRQSAPECGEPRHGNAPLNGWIVGLFALMGLLFGFLIRGYLIRRIEGGL